MTIQPFRSLPRRTGKRPTLPQVTLCAATSINMEATLHALVACLGQIRFARCKLLTDALFAPGHPEIEVVPIRRLESSKDYSRFMLSELVNHVETSHCLVVQWDGYVLDARRWQPWFLDYDYIGASWPQFDDGHDVGNGGFSLRSRKLMQACLDPAFVGCHPEDVTIGRVNRPWLESRGLRFAPREIADMFAAERTGDVRYSFGFHGAFNMPAAIGTDAFWEIYRTLDDRSTIWHDFGSFLEEVRHGPRPIERSVRMLLDRFKRPARKKTKR